MEEFERETETQVLKDIQGIAKVLYGHYCGEDECGKCKMPDCLYFAYAKRLREAGYAKSTRWQRTFCEI